MAFNIIINNTRKITIDYDQLAKHQYFQIDENHAHLRINGTNYACEISQNGNTKNQTITINGMDYHIQIQDELDQLIDSMGLNELHKPNSSNILSPMPGLVLEIMVKPGENISKDQPLLILEAMKMENIIKAEGDGVIDKIQVIKGDKVEKSQMLILLKKV